ncbi:E1-E2 ATPase-domain-containing protein [Aspergillus granulosus]|uniref:E1-E2 ATPase-domain-containing protein n=1 Tax=Aspergillus granulosus TaxID=176169 RepID=A0ABR4GYF1_9EURO
MGKSCCGDGSSRPVESIVPPEPGNCRTGDRSRRTASYEASQPSISNCRGDCCRPSVASCDRNRCPVGPGGSSIEAVETVSSACSKACCGDASKLPQQSEACREKESKQDTCCSSSSCDRTQASKLPQLPVACREKEDTCCSSSTCDKTQGRESADISEPESHVDDPNNPSCCSGKAKPCCDVSCLDRIAVRECGGDGISKVATTLSLTSRCQGTNGGRACEQHKRATRAKYAATLEALGCICRALLALGQESCCPPQKVSPLSKRRSATKPSRAKNPVPGKAHCIVEFNASSESRGRSSQSGPGSHCEKPCCRKSQLSPEISTAKANSVIVNNAPDLEKGILDTEHVILSISGMTCTGCETKLNRSLAMLNSVHNIKTSLVLSRAEFDLDLSTLSLTEVIKHLERTTEFKFERVGNQGANVDIIVGDAATFAKQEWPQGVTEVTVVSSTIVNVGFDATVIGARDLVERGFGRPFTLAPPRADPTHNASSKHVRHMGFMTMLSIVLTIPVLVLAWAPLPERKLAYGSASLVLTTLVQFVIAGPFYPKALKSLVFSKVIEMDLLIVLSTTAAYVFSVVSFGYLAANRPLSTGEFFETSTLLVTLIMVGRFVAAHARQKAVESISVQSLQESVTTLVDEHGTGDANIDVRLLQHGDFFKVAPHSKVPTDGTVVLGSSEVDESMVTGESMPVEKRAGSAVIAGSINGAGTLVVRLTRLPSDNTISLIAAMVDQAKLSKPKIQDIADRVASYFVPIVVVLTIVTFVIWIAICITVRQQSGSQAVTTAITYAITVLIVSCPCAIGLAVPMVIVIATGVAAERGIIFKSAESIEVAYRTAHVVFDKTGTLTQGKLDVVSEEYIDFKQGASSSLLLGLIDSNTHPVSAAVAAHLKSKNVSASVVNDSKAIPGNGIEGSAPGLVLRAGNCHWLNVSSHPHVCAVLSRGYTAFCFTINGSLAAVFGLHDSIRSDALDTVTKLRDRGTSVHILSGDDDGAVRRVANVLNVAEANIRSRCTPSDKRAYIENLLASVSAHRRRKSRRQPVVVFCGDGTNDAVALAQATIGVHMNEGTDVAKSAADVVLMAPNLAGILHMIAISEASVNRIKFNFAWSFVYNVFAILLGAGAFVRFRIPPEFAGLGELVSVVPVIIAAVLLRWVRI